MRGQVRDPPKLRLLYEEAREHIASLAMYQQAYDQTKQPEQAAVQADPGKTQPSVGGALVAARDSGTALASFCARCGHKFGTVGDRFCAQCGLGRGTIVET